MNNSTKSPITYFSNKIFIGIALFVIGAGIALNITYFATQERPSTFQTRTQAKDNIAQDTPTPSPSIPTVRLSDLPYGCKYEIDMTINCPTPIPLHSIALQLIEGIVKY